MAGNKNSGRTKAANPLSPHLPVRLPEELYERIKVEAAAKGIPASTLVRMRLMEIYAEPARRAKR